MPLQRLPDMAKGNRLILLPAGPQFPTQSHQHDGPDSLAPPYRYESQGPQARIVNQYELSPDIIAALTRALAQNNAAPSASQAPMHAPTRKYFSKVITNTTSELPMPVIKELKGGFKNYILLALCTHRACVTSSNNQTSCQQTLSSSVA